MKRRKLSRFWNALHTICSLMLMLNISLIDTAVVPPPWSDPAKNPCASMVGGWQLLYWPPLKKCFKIFAIGYPCPDTMELSPTASVSSVGKKLARNVPIAECRCPPGTALSAKTQKCHKIFERGPCDIGEYFSPQMDNTINGRRTMTNNHQEGTTTHYRWGECRKSQNCTEGMIYWPKDNKCYTKYTKGPCSKGKLLILNDEQLAECKCENKGTLSKYFYTPEETCYEHYTKGPCTTPGQLFLPGGRCDCHMDLPHFHKDFQMCFELNTAGPCPPGNIYTIPDNATQPRAQCQCKESYVPWPNGRCYRLYTRGPCASNEFLINATSCVKNFCGKSRLYFPEQKSCYRIGSQGPCDLYQVVVFDFTVRPSVDGISYNGMCGCSGVIANLDQKCNANEIGAESLQVSACESTTGMVELNGICYKLYSRGPCGPGQWLEPLKSIVNSGKTIPSDILYKNNKAKCVCRPGYTKAESNNENTMTDGNGYTRFSAIQQRCNAPSVGLARWFLEIFG